MRFPITAAFVPAFAALTNAQCDPAQDPTVPGYSSSIPSTIPSNESVSFGSNYAVLQLDLQNALVGPIANTSQGSAFIQNVKTWNDAVHQLSPQPLTIFTRIVAARLGNPAEVETEIYPSFTVDNATDTVLEKAGYYAGIGNNLEGILAGNNITSVVLSGIRTSGVIQATATRLNDLAYNVYVIANNSIETPPNNPCIHESLLEGTIPKLGVNVVTIEQALGAISPFSVS